MSNCRGCGVDLDKMPPFEVHASVCGSDWNGLENADVSDPSDRVNECQVCMTPMPAAIDVE